ncbi:MAG: hypothetical protein GY915_05895, partial [bacterium]|nr:hypothetical protein [bacterium]
GFDTGVLQDDVQHPEKVGVLLFDGDGDSVIGFVGWRFPDGKVDHAPAFISFNLKHLAQHSYPARKIYSDVPEEVLARILSLVYAHVPAGFLGEMEELKNLKDDVTQVDDMAMAAMKEATAELPFLLAVMIFLATENHSLDEIRKDYFKLKLPQRRWRDKFLTNGFSRKRRSSGTYLRFLS